MLFSPNSKLVMIGDSITDCGRAQPFGESWGLGDGYVKLVDALLAATYPDLLLRIVNVGTSGHTVRDLASRWDRDVLSQKPDYVSVMIGTNDVWRQFDNPTRPETHVYPAEYAHTLRKLVEQTKPHVREMILMTPFFVEPLREDKMRARMDEYGAIVKAVSSEFGTVFVDTQAAFDAMLHKNYSATLALDRVHPNPAGHMVIARAFLKSINYQWQ